MAANEGNTTGFLRKQIEYTAVVVRAQSGRKDWLYCKVGERETRFNPLAQEFFLILAHSVYKM